MTVDPKCLRELISIAMSVMAAPEPDEAVSALVRAVVHEMKLRAAIVRLLEPERRRLRVVASHGLSDAYLHKGPVEVTDGSLDARVLGGATIELDDVTTDAAFQYGAGAAKEGLRSALAVPILVHDEPLGLLRAYTGEPHRFSAEERSVLEAAALLFGEAFEKSRRSAALQAIERDVGSTLELAEVLDRLLHHMVEGLQFSAALIRIVDEEGGLALARARGLSRRYLRAGVRRGDDPVDARVLRGETVLIRDLEAEGGLPFVDEALREGIRSVLSVPLVSRARVFGLVRVYSRRPRSWDAYDLRFVQVAAELGALAIDNAILHRMLKDRVEELGAQVSGWYQFLAMS